MFGEIDGSRSDAATVGFSAVNKNSLSPTQQTPTVKLEAPPANGSNAVNITFTLPPTTNKPVHWSAQPYGDKANRDAWTPEQFTQQISTRLTRGQWLIVGSGEMESDYRAIINIHEGMPDNLTFIIPHNNTMGGEGPETDASIMDKTTQLIANLKSTFIDMQAQQTTAHVLNEMNRELQTFIPLAKGKLSSYDFADIAALLTLMGEPFMRSLSAWQAAESDVTIASLNTEIYPTKSPETHKNTNQETDRFALVCKKSPSCRYDNTDFNLHLNVPEGWSLSIPYFSETITGIIAQLATTSFVRDDVMVTLNQRMATGDCQQTLAGNLCRYPEDSAKINDQDWRIIVAGARSGANPKSIGNKPVVTQQQRLQAIPLPLSSNEIKMILEKFSQQPTPQEIK